MAFNFINLIYYNNFSYFLIHFFYYSTIPFYTPNILFTFRTNFRKPTFKTSAKNLCFLLLNPAIFFYAERPCKIVSTCSY